MASGLNATTLQLNLVKNLVDAYIILDMKNILPFISQNYTYQTFPKVPDLPDEAKGDHLEKYGMLFSLAKESVVRVRKYCSAFSKLAG